MGPEELDHVNAHATSTPEGDRAELQALSTLLGEHGPAVSISANKSMLGHTLGAAGALESVAVIQAIREGAVPPTINLEHPDQYADGLDLTPDEATHRPIRAALNNSFGFGGQNAALVFKRWEG
jgi:3-oxoacyl-[acyl-carrier-protein] synthase II